MPFKRADAPNKVPMTAPIGSALPESSITWSDRLKAFRPAPVFADNRERWRAAMGAVFGVLLTALLSRWLAGHSPQSVWLVAPVGASAVLVFAVPASPLAQPWSVVGGNTVSALVGIACANLISDVPLAAALAVSLAIAAMFMLRCLHPPGGAMALFMVLIHGTHWGFAGFPVMLNSTLLVLVGMGYNTATGRRYPHQQVATRGTAQTAQARFSTADLDAALTHYNQVLDISRDDLEDLLAQAEKAAYRRHLGEVRCADIMSRDLITVEFGTSLQDAWGLLRQRGIKALPVVDRVQRLVGVVTVADFLRHANLDLHEGFADRLRAFVARSGRTHSDKPEVVGQIMTRQVRVASVDRPVMELAALFSEGGHHHIPIVGEQSRLVGIITQSDFVRALYRAVRPPDAGNAGN